MARTYIFDNTPISIPGVYSNIEAAVDNPTIALAAGNGLIIDTGLDSNYTGGSGSIGEFKSGKDSLSLFTNARGLRNFVGGPLSKVADALFSPAGSNPGSTSIRYINAATTVAASITYSLETAGAVAIGDLTIKPLKEGLAANGSLSGSKLVRGYGAKWKAGSENADAVVLEIYQGGYQGTESTLSPEGGDVDGISQAKSVEKLIVRSPEFTTFEAIVAWMQSDVRFNSSFKLTASSGTGGAIEVADLTAGQLAYTLASGGTTAYDTTSLDAALDAVADENIDFVLLLDSGAEARSTGNIRIFNFYAQEADVKASLVVGGYITSLALRGATNSTESIAVGYDSEQVIPVHGGIFLPDPANPNRLKEYNSLMTAAFYLGRASGLAPQVPGTFKNLGISGLTHNPLKVDKEFAIRKGILMIHNDGGSYDILKDINSLQLNDNLINPDGTTYQNSIVRIKRQINKELKADLKATFLKNPVGSNQYTTSVEAVVSRAKKFLTEREATSTADNIILRFQDVTARIESDAIFLDYKVVVNGPIDYIFATGLIIN